MLPANFVDVVMGNSFILSGQNGRPNVVDLPKKKMKLSGYFFSISSPDISDERRWHDDS